MKKNDDRLDEAALKAADACESGEQFRPCGARAEMVLRPRGSQSAGHAGRASLSRGPATDTHCWRAPGRPVLRGRHGLGTTGLEKHPSSFALDTPTFSYILKNLFHLRAFGLSCIY